MSKMQLEQVQALLKEAVESFPHDACSTCECFLGYIAQLRVESDAECKEAFAPYKVRREDIHKCLGCDPCPPGNLYAEYMKKKQSPPLITL
jgi:hypothetical protein